MLRYMLNLLTLVRLKVPSGSSLSVPCPVGDVVPGAPAHVVLARVDPLQDALHLRLLLPVGPRAASKQGEGEVQ